jgi:hypothetical protein
MPDKWSGAFTLLARGSFLVSSERKKDGTITGVFIKSIKGNACTLINPWPAAEVVVAESDEEGREFFLMTSKENLIKFNTLPNHSYLILPKDSNNKVFKTIFTSTPNRSPKYFHEAVIGKERNF